MDKTKIEWADATWNPVTGCFHGCEYCYARRIALRFCPTIYPHLGDPGMEGAAKLDSDEGMDTMLELEKPYKVDGRAVPYPMGFYPTLHKYRLIQPRKWTEPRTIFVCSMADLFGEWVPDEWIDAVFDACRAAPQHRYMFLTKNPKRLCDLFNAGQLPEGDNFWWGSTITNKNSLRFPGAFGLNTFLSIEPLHECLDAGIGSFGRDRLIIIGAESGNRSGKIVPEKAWVDNICDAARLTRASVFMKDSLIPIVGEEKMRRELPWEAQK